jgi:site-specific DNA recombinase
MKIKRSTGSRRTAIYLRMSSDAQEGSIEQQREAATMYAADHDLTVVAEYIDEGITGVDSVNKRPGFQKMVVDAQDGKFDFSLVWSQSRLSRSSARNFIVEMSPLADAGVKLWTQADGEIDLDDFMGFIRSSMNAESDNKYIRELSKGVVRGQRSTSLEGKWVSGTIPFGLDYVKGDRKKNPQAGNIILGSPDDVETVRRVFAWYLAGYSDRGILELLRNERGLVRTQTFVQRMLNNPLYVGDYVWNARSTARFSALRDGRVTDEFSRGKTSEADRVYLPNNHPAIIDRETFTRVQLMRVERAKKTTPFRNGGEHLLTGLCQCGSCGSRFSGSLNKGKLMLTCNGYRHGKCPGNYVSQADVVASVVASFDHIISDEYANAIKKEYTDSLKDKSSESDLRTLKNELTKQERNYDSLREKLKLLPADLVADFAEDLRKQKQEVAQLRQRVIDVEAFNRDAGTCFERLDDQLSGLKDIVGALKEAVSVIASTEPRLVRELIASMVDKITLDVKDRGQGKSPRFILVDGEIALKPGFNLLPAS